MVIFRNDTYTKNIAVQSDGGSTLTYQDLYQFSEQLGNYTKSRSLVFCLCNNETGTLAGYYSFLEHGVVPVMLDASKDFESICNLLKIYQPNYVWAPIEFAGQIEKTGLFSAYNYSLLSFSEEKLQLHEDLALLLSTSGSTGSPKLVRLSYRNVLSNAASIAEYLQIDENERPITSLPMHYSYGLSVVNSHLIKGATILLTDKPVVQKEFWTFAKEQKATSIAGVPFTYEMLKRLRFFRMDLPELKTMTQAGGKLNAELAKEYIEQAQAVGKRFIVMYGQTEATARMSYLPCEHALEKYGSIGIPVPGGSFALVGDDGKEINCPFQEGELVYSGANVSLGYAESVTDLAKGDENKGVLYTGDIAQRDEDGFYYITGRKKRFIKIYGNRVNLDTVESLLNIRFKKTYICSGEDDHLIVYTTGNGQNNEEVIPFLAEKTGLNNRAFAVKVVKEIPKNSSGKILYAELNERTSGRSDDCLSVI
jgi:acyl-coenzyme A synthetase/AMP-(fatty) acid ligase